MSLPYVTIDYIGVVIAVVVSFLFGWLWYSQLFFGKIWVKLNGFSKSDIKKNHNDQMLGKMVLMILGTGVSAVILTYLVKVVTINTFMQGAYLGAILAVGFTLMTTILGSVLWERKPWSLFVLNGAYWIINLALIGGIVSVWA